MDVSLDMCMEAPRLIEMHVKQAVRRQYERMVAATLRSTDCAPGSRADLDTPRRILRSKSEKALAECDKTLFRVIVGGGIWTNKMRYDAGLWDTPKCAMCGKHIDSLFHRIWECDHPEVSRARKENARSSLCNAALEAGPDSAKFTRCIDHIAVSDAEGEAIRYTRDGIRHPDKGDWSLSGDIFYDGSCQKAPGLSLATYAAVQVDSESNIVAYVQGTVPSYMPQSSQAAEHCGRLAAIRLMTGQSTLYGDCKNVVMAAGLSDEAAQGYSMYSGMRRQAIRCRRLDHVLCDIKVKAHRDESEASSAQDLARIRGNTFADELAKIAMDLHPQAGDRVAAAKQRYQDMVDIARTMVATVKLWPATVKMVKDAPDVAQTAPPKSAPARLVSHTWAVKHAAEGNAYFCTTCLTTTRELRTHRIKYYQKCPGICLTLASVVAFSEAHTLAFTTTEPGGEIIIACIVCGHYASSRVCKLRDLRLCAGGNPYGRQTLRRMQCGMHPNPASKERVSALIPFTREQRENSRIAADEAIDNAWSVAKPGRGLGRGRAASRRHDPGRR